MVFLPHSFRFVFSLIACLLAASVSRAAAPAPDDLFERKIRPLLIEKCYSCHSAQAKKLRGELFLDTKDGVLHGGKDGPILTPGDPEHSRLIEAIRWTNDDLKMPPKERLTPAQVADLVEWVKQGAPDPRTGPSKPMASGIDLAEARKAWAYHPPQVHPLPMVKRAEWCRSPMDRFILAKLEERGLSPAPPAPRRQLIRRAYFDVIGLPPSPEQVEAFVNDASPDALRA